jgi:hypothetical protein
MACDLIKLIDSVLREENVSGGSGSVYGSGVTVTSGAVSRDSYVHKDCRIPMILGKVQRRQFPKNILTPKKLKTSKK